MLAQFAAGALAYTCRVSVQKRSADVATYVHQATTTNGRIKAGFVTSLEFDRKHCRILYYITIQQLLDQ